MSIFDIVWLLANTFLFFLVTHFWGWLSNLDPIQLSVLILIGYIILCWCSCFIITQWLGVDEDKFFGFCLVCMVVLMGIHWLYYEHIQEKK